MSNATWNESQTSVPSAATACPVWWQRMSETGKGLTAGFRANSAFFFYFFTTSVLISFAFVLGVTGTQWSILLLSVTVALSSEMFYFVVKKLQDRLAERLGQEDQQLFVMAKASCMLLLVGSIGTITAVLITRIWILYG